MVCHSQKKLEELDFVDEEFLHKKINKKQRLLVDLSYRRCMYQKGSLSQALWRFDSIELK